MLAGGMSLVTTLFAPITERAPIETPLVTTTFAPSQHVVGDPRRPLGVEALPGDRPGRIVEAVVAVGDQAAVGEHAVVADLHQLDRGDHRALVDEDARADADPPVVAAPSARHRAPAASPARSRVVRRAAARAARRSAAISRTPGVAPARGAARAGSRAARRADTSATCATTAADRRSAVASPVIASPAAVRCPARAQRSRRPLQAQLQKRAGRSVQSRSVLRCVGGPEAVHSATARPGGGGRELHRRHDASSPTARVSPAGVRPPAPRRPSGGRPHAGYRRAAHRAARRDPFRDRGPQRAVHGGAGGANGLSEQAFVIAGTTLQVPAGGAAVTAPATAGTAQPAPARAPRPPAATSSRPGRRCPESRPPTGSRRPRWRPRTASRTRPSRSPGRG